MLEVLIHFLLFFDNRLSITFMARSSGVRRQMTHLKKDVKLGLFTGDHSIEWKYRMSKLLNGTLC